MSPNSGFSFSRILLALIASEAFWINSLKGTMALVPYNCSPPRLLTSLATFVTLILVSTGLQPTTVINLDSLLGSSTDATPFAYSLCLLVSSNNESTSLSSLSIIFRVSLQIHQLSTSLILNGDFEVKTNLFRSILG